MRIGELAARSGASARSLRYYEQHGLLGARRTATGQRVYDEEALDRVALLRRLYGAGLSSDVIASVLPCVDTPSIEVTGTTVRTMRRERDRIEAQLQALTTTRDQLAYLIDQAEAHGRAQLAPSGQPTGHQQVTGRTP